MPLESTYRDESQVPAFPEQFDILDEAGPSAEVWYVRRMSMYVSTCQALGSGDIIDSLGAEGSLAANAGFSMPTEDFAFPAPDLVHGDEAATWASVGRRALLRRMDED